MAATMVVQSLRTLWTRPSLPTDFSARIARTRYTFKKKQTSPLRQIRGAVHYVEKLTADLIARAESLMSGWTAGRHD